MSSIIGGEALARAVEAAYQAGQTDYYLEPLALVDENRTPVGKIKDGDQVVFCCRRGEREIELTDAFVDPAFPHFERDYMKDLSFVIMTMYHEKFKDLPIAFAPEKVVKPLAQVIGEAGLRQFHCAESEKYAHVTFFFNGGREEPYEGEDRILVASPKVATYDLQPEMSAPEVAEKLAAEIRRDVYDFVVVNFANGDMVGHTGIYEAIEKAVKAVDDCVRDTIEAAKASGYEAIIIADHGNADNAINPDGTPNTAHSLNPVPCVYITDNKAATVENGILADVAPTILHIMGIPQPAEMTGHNLVNP